jgi:hypothetical protein
VNASLANWLLGGTVSGTDADGDGIPDVCDNCLGLSNPGQDDADHDGIGDACNDGDDGDGDEWADALDNCPATSNSGQEDADFDGTGDACDVCFGFSMTDSDADAFCDDFDNCPGLANPDQQDSDFDGFGDACDPCFGFGATDTDGDGFCDFSDNCPLIANPGQEDSDFDGFGNACDTCTGFGAADTDGDGPCDPIDNCPLVPNPGQQDTDFDGVGNACNDAQDADGDEWANFRDNCPNASNPTQQDSDFDGFGDACDACVGPGVADPDGDALCSPVDNCPTIANPGQEDANGDDIGDACSPRVSIGPITSAAGDHSATVIIDNPLHRPLSGTAEICDGADVTGLSFTWLATRCFGSDTLALTVNGVAVAVRPIEPNVASCSCTPGVTTFTVPIGTVQPLLDPGGNRIGIRKSDDGTALLAWAYATVTTSHGPQRVEIFDHTGGNNYDNPDLCLTNSTSAAVDTAAAHCTAVASESWSGTLPCSLDVSGLADRHYGLVVTATDGVIGSPSRDSDSFAHDGEATLFINTSCELACDENTDECISVCPAVPRNDCKTAGKSTFVRTRSSDGSKDKLAWTWRRGEATTVDELGDPSTTADYVLCLYGGSTAALISGGQIVVPKSANWTPVGNTAWSYDDSSTAADGVRRVSLRASSQDKARAQLKGRGVELPDFSLPLVPASFPLVVQLLNSETSMCVESAFSAGDVSKNNEASLKAKH